MNPILEAFEENVTNPSDDDLPSGVGAQRHEITELWLWYLATGNQEISWEDAHIAEAWAKLLNEDGIVIDTVLNDTDLDAGPMYEGGFRH